MTTRLTPALIAALMARLAPSRAGTISSLGSFGSATPSG